VRDANATGRYTRSGADLSLNENGSRPEAKRRGACLLVRGGDNSRRAYDGVP
jgi:hypothetical protein